jgi:hypothetical protein
MTNGLNLMTVKSKNLNQNKLKKNASEELQVIRDLAVLMKICGDGEE